VISSVLGPVDVHRTGDDGLQVAAGPARNPELVRAMVQAGIEVHEIRSAERSLEEVFFEMTAPPEPPATHTPEEEMAR
jgi:ABC-2 type transport system ATP-binding protein